jgi:two-component system LytT family response regulator
MQVLIVDNEKNVRESLVNLIRLFCEDIKEIYESDSINSTLDILNKIKPDLLFLDVELDEGTGMDILNSLTEINFPVVFVTAHEHYAKDAFRYSALDFLVKPVDPVELIAVIEKAKKFKDNQELMKQVLILKEYMKFDQNSDSSKIVLRDNQSIYFVKLRDIIYCEAQASYTIFYLTNGEQIVITKIIKEFEGILEPKGFIRVHKSFIVNKFHVQKFDRNEGGRLILSGGHIVDVSVRKKDFVLAALSM